MENTPKICFVDTETTSLRPDRRAWEIGIIERQPGQDDIEHRWYIDTGDLALGNADLISLRIGRYYDRHPQVLRGRLSQSSNLSLDVDFTEVYEEADALEDVEGITRGSHLVGAVPNFDAEVLAARMRAHGICPSWHYHLIDVETLAVGYLALSAREALSSFDPLKLPWKSDELSFELGITVSDEDKHTALGDARWARAIYDVVTAGK